MPSATLFERAQKYVAKMPAAVAGSGGHNVTFHVACVLLQGFDLPRGEARQILDEFNARCEPPWSDREIEHKLNQADKMSGLETREGMQPRGCMARETERDDGSRVDVPPSRAPAAPLPMTPPARPEFAPEKLRAFARRWRPYVDTAWLAERSAILPFGLSGGLSPDDYLRAVFREGEKVVLFTNQQSQGQAMWPLQRPPLGGDEGVWYLAQPVDGLEYVNPRAKKDDGSPRLSRRSEESVTSWRHLVLESDEADARDWLGALVQLPLRIVAIYTSGGRSIHALVRIDAKSKGNWDGIVKQIRPVLVTLGADPKAMSAVRLTRLPGCLRGEKLQKLLYLNPDPEPLPICGLSIRNKALDPFVGFAETLLTMTPAAVREQGAWGDVETTLAALSWYESAAPARAMLARLRAWGGAEAP